MTRGLGGESPANVQNFLHGISYPAGKQDLIRCAKSNRAPKEVIDVIERLPDQQFGGPQDVMKGYSTAHKST